MQIRVSTELKTSVWACGRACACSLFSVTASAARRETAFLSRSNVRSKYLLKCLRRSLGFIRISRLDRFCSCFVFVPVSLLFLFHICSCFVFVSFLFLFRLWAAAPKGRCSIECRGYFVRPSVRPRVRISNQPNDRPTKTAS